MHVAIMFKVTSTPEKKNKANERICTIKLATFTFLFLHYCFYNQPIRLFLVDKPPIDVLPSTPINVSESKSTESS